MLLNFLMLLLLVGLFIFCATLVRFAEGVIGPQGASREEAHRESFDVTRR
jgi:hypothetical protein